MPCPDPHMVQFSIALPGDESRIWIENSPVGYYVGGHRTVVTGPTPGPQESVTEDQLGRASPLKHIYQAGELYVVNLFFDPNTTPGKSADVHAEVFRRGALHHSWCTTVTSGTPDPDFATYAVKGQP